MKNRDRMKLFVNDRFELSDQEPRRRLTSTSTEYSFERATHVFRDPLALSIPDEEHSETEVRWITLGRDASGRYVLVVHTFEQLNH